MEQNQKSESYHVIGTSSLTEEKTIVLKHNETFGIFNKIGDIIPLQNGAQGIYHHGTRFLSQLRFKIEGLTPLFLSSNLREKGEMFVVDLTNPDIVADGVVVLKKGSAHILRKKVIWESYYYEQLQFSNFGLEETEFNIELKTDADFADIFEIRGTKRRVHGKRQPVKVEERVMWHQYIGADNVERTTCITMDPVPDQMDDNRMYYNIRLDPGETYTISSNITFMRNGKKEGRAHDFKGAVKKHQRWLELIDQNSCNITTSNQQFNQWINRSRHDLNTMISSTPHGLYPFAGIPWYDATFGRDGIITALECLWLNPSIARGVLDFLAATQAQQEDSFRDAEPGKILHEAREGEMAELDEVPFKRYYGSVDATPLFVVLAGEYYLRTADLETISRIWNNIEAALNWISRYGDINNDSFVEYTRKEETGLLNQGWKDSPDSVFHENGDLAHFPVALCEVQAYVYDAWKKAALLARELEFDEKSEEYSENARRIKQNFSKRFWDDEKGSFHLAIADGEPCRVLTSNAGHCLFTGIASNQQAEMIIRNLMSEQMFSGWGIRTLASREARFNPMSYHNGSVWPHDNALIMKGMARYGFKDEVIKTATAIYEASLFYEGQRLPELFCGFTRRKSEAPTSFPVACSPQAWSVASPFLIIQSMLGMEINLYENLIRFYRPALPHFLDNMTLSNLQFKNFIIRLHFIRTGDTLSISSDNRQVRIEIIY